MTILQKIAKLQVTKNALLELQDNGIICNNTAIQEIIMEEQILKKQFVNNIHKGEIKEKSRKKNGKVISYWWAEVKGDNSKYKQITATTEEGLYNKLYEFYNNSNNKIITLEDAFKAWHKEREIDCKIHKTIAATTWDDDIVSWNRFFKNTSIAKKEIISITIKDILDYYKSITGNGLLKKKAFDRAKRILNFIYDYLLTEGIVEQNLARQTPISRLKFKPEDDNSGEYYTKEERDILLNFLYNIQDKNVYHLAVSLCACLGKRIGEIKALTWNDVDIKNKKLIIHHQITLQYKEDSNKKTFEDTAHLKCYQKPQVINLSDYAIYIIKELKKINGNKSYILQSKGNKPITTSNFNKNLKMYCEACKIRYFSSHKFRFYTASEMYEQNVDELQIMRFLNHSDVTMTRKYDRRKKDIITAENTEKILGFIPKGHNWSQQNLEKENSLQTANL